jgi:hypothetical protein
MSLVHNDQIKASKLSMPLSDGLDPTYRDPMEAGFLPKGR